MKMKFFKYAAIALLGGMVVFTGCNKEEEPTVFDDPTVTIEQGASLVLTPSEGPTYDLSLKVTIDAPGKINEIKIQRTKFLGSTIVKEDEFINQEHFDKTEATLNYPDNINFEIFFDGSVDKIVYDFIVTDRAGNLGSADFTITMGAYTPLTTEVTTGEIWKIHSLGKACWNLKEDVAVTGVGNADEVVASRYIINSDSVNTATSDPNFTGSWTSDEVNWISTNGNPQNTKGNGTLYVKANDYDYTNAPKEVALSLYGAGTPSKDVENPAVGDIYIGKLGEELYVIKITENNIDEEYQPKANTGVLRFSYKK